MFAAADAYRISSRVKARSAKKLVMGSILSIYSLDVNRDFCLAGLPLVHCWVSPRANACRQCLSAARQRITTDTSLGLKIR